MVMAGRYASASECWMEMEVEIMKLRTLLIACLLLLSMACLTHAFYFPSATYMPFDRLIANVEAYVRDHPKDPQGYYTLARMHYFAFVDQMPYVPMDYYASVIPPRVAEEWQISRDRLLIDLRHVQATQMVLDEWKYATEADVPPDRRKEFQTAVQNKERELTDQGWKPERLDTRQVLTHAGAAVDNFERALDLDPENGLSYLGLASLYEQYSSYVADVNITDHPPQLAHVTLVETRVMYYLAFRFSAEEDLKSDHVLVLWGMETLASYEAGTAYLRLAKKDPSIADANSVAQVETDLERLREHVSIGITPMIFSTQRHESVVDLLAPQTRVSFDLDGTGRKAQWPWVKPTTGLLVWDPFNKGEITSGRQLFGTATWWLLFANGYAALDTLDDNRDGSLSGRELKGIGVWFDKNADGRSEPGEVQPVTDFGVQAIRTRSTGSDHGMLMNPNGIILKDGTVVPTYDWVVSPIKPMPQTTGGKRSSHAGR